jgi:hypothetical protein
LKVFFIIFAIFITICNKAPAYEFISSGEDVDGFTFESDADGKISTIKPIKFNHFLYLANEVVLSKITPIFSFEEDKLESAFPGINAPKGDAFTKINYNPAVHFSLRNERYLISTFASLSSVYSNKDFSNLELEKYGINAKFRTLTFLQRRIAIYTGYEASQNINFYGELEGERKFVKSVESLFFSSLHVRLPLVFAKLDIGYKNNSKNKGANIVVDFFIKGEFWQDLNGFFQARVDVERDYFKTRRSFDAFGSAYYKVGYIYDLNKDFMFSLFLGYEKNKKYGFKKEEVGLSLTYKLRLF